MSHVNTDRVGGKPGVKRAGIDFDQRTFLRRHRVYSDSLVFCQLVSRLQKNVNLLYLVGQLASGARGFSQQRGRGYSPPCCAEINDGKNLKSTDDASNPNEIQDAYAYAVQPWMRHVVPSIQSGVSCPCRVPEAALRARGGRC